MSFFLAPTVFSAALSLAPGVVVTQGGSYGKTEADPGATPMTPYCFPGVAGVPTCPCSNPPAVIGAQQGCDNGATGGAILDASGSASIFNDSLSIEVGNSLPTLHTLYVGNFIFGSGLIFGAGVRCVGGAVKVLAIGTPSSGPPSTIAFTGIYAKSSAAGVPPVAGQTCCYFVAYDNPAMATVCSAPVSFNATNSGYLTWGP